MLYLWYAFPDTQVFGYIPKYSDIWECISIYPSTWVCTHKIKFECIPIKSSEAKYNNYTPTSILTKAIGIIRPPATKPNRGNVKSKICAGHTEHANCCLYGALAAKVGVHRQTSF